ncbi:MAG: DUF1700 domain-containing protein [bacterium]|nr:DUF1700 domain-containing protein [bacterium]
MEKKEFLQSLRDHLSGEVPTPVLESNIRYYESYISEHGKTSEEMRRCIDEMGDPRLIATTIITSYRMSNGNENTQYSDDVAYEEPYNDENDQEPFKSTVLKMIPLKYKIIGILSTIAILILLFFIAKALLPVIIVVFLFVMIEKIVRK